MASSVEYPVLVGVVQQFGDRIAVETKQAGDVTVREYTVKSAVRGPDGKQALIRVTLWPEYAHVKVKAGDTSITEGKVTVTQGKSATFINQNASVVAIVPCAERREPDESTQNQTSAAPDSDDEPPF